MDGLRYSLALIALLIWPPALVFWYVVHPLHRFWKRVGPPVTYTVTFSLMIVVALLVWNFRAHLLVLDLGSALPLQLLSIIPLCASIFLRQKRRKVLKIGVMAGLAEISPDQHVAPLLTDGIYSQIRHPRYLELLFSLVAFALFTNFGSLYIFLGIGCIGLYGIVLLEEKELRTRYGQTYLDYAKEVPRFFPRVRPS